MPLERIGPSVAFDGRPVSVPSPAHVYNPASAPSRSNRRPTSLDAIGAAGPPASLTRSSSSGSAYSLRSFGGRTSDILRPLDPANASEPNRPVRRSRLRSPSPPPTSASCSPASPTTPIDNTPPPPQRAPLLARVVSSIGNPRSRRGNVDLLSQAAPAPAPASASAPTRPERLNPGLQAPKVSFNNHPSLSAPDMVPSPPSLSPPPSPPLPPAAPAPSPIAAPQRQLGRRFAGLGASASAATSSSLHPPAPLPPQPPPPMRRKRLPSEPLPLLPISPPPASGKARASVSTGSDGHAIEAPPAYRRRHSGRFLACTLSQTLLRAPRFPAPREPNTGLALPEHPSRDAESHSPMEATPGAPLVKVEDGPLPADGEDQPTWAHVVPTLGAITSLSTPSESPSRPSSLKIKETDNPLCIDSLIARLQAAVAGGETPPAQPQPRPGSQGIVLRTPTTSELSMFLSRQEGPSANPSKSAGALPLAKVDEEDDDKPLAHWNQFHREARLPPSPARPPAPVPEGAEVIPFVAKPPGEKRGICEYTVLKEIGRGAYGVVQLARLSDPLHGQPAPPQGAVGETVVIKYIVKSRILADCWRRHRTLGTIPTEIHVMDQLRRLPYPPPQSWPPWSPEKLLPGRFSEILSPAESISRAQGVQVGEPLYHPNLTHMLDFFEDAEYYYLVMRRFGQGQDVFDFVESSAGGLRMREVRCIAGQLASALVFLHEHGMVHRDIKDENVILDGAPLHAQLIDFGSAAHRSRSLRKRFDTFSGTLEYAAAEILRGESYDGPPQDMWAWGVVLYVLLCGECPFWNGEEALGALQDPHSRPAETLRKRAALGDIAHGDDGQQDMQDDGGGAVADAIELIHLCLGVEPGARPSARQVCTHRFFAGHEGWSGPHGWSQLDPHWGEQWLGPLPDA